jgi:transcriptional regulator with XRE-family HTH domain
MTKIVRWKPPLYGLDGLTLGERLRRVRKRTGRQAQEVASSIEVRHEALSRWENDQHIPELPAFSALAEYYGISMDELLWGSLTESATTTARQHELAPT